MANSSEHRLSKDPRDLGRRIIAHSRKFRLGDTAMDEWRGRLERLLEAQPDLRPPFKVSNVRALEGGAGSSSGTLFFEAEIGERAAREYVLRFQPADLLFHVCDIDGQNRIQRALSQTDVPVPAQCWEDVKGRQLTVPGYVMERVQGEAAPAAWFSEGLIADASPANRRELVFSFVHTLARIHAVDWRKGGLSFLLQRAEGPGLVGREVNWYWDALTAAGETAAMERLEPVREWLLANQPHVNRPVLCHGDANFTNNVFSNNRVSAVLDWEMAFIGTPECDVAYAVTSMAALTADLPAGVPSADEMVAEYERVSGHRLQNMPYYVLFFHYRVSAILNLGRRAFPSEFQQTFRGYIDRTESKLAAHARSLGAGR